MVCPTDGRNMRGKGLTREYYCKYFCLLRFFNIWKSHCLHNFPQWPCGWNIYKSWLWCCWDFEGRGRQEQIRGWYFKLFFVHSVTKRAREPPLWLQTSWITIFLLILLSLLYLWLPKVQLYSIVASDNWVYSFSGLKKSIGDLMCKWLNRDVRIF